MSLLFKFLYTFIFLLITFSNLCSQIDYYWVGKGNSTSWYNSDNWSSFSGGPASYPDSTYPSPNDNVFFDSLSFSGPTTLSFSLIWANNMVWQNVKHSPILDVEEYEIRGTLILDTGMTIINGQNNYGGELLFENNDTIKSQISLAGHIFESITFDTWLSSSPNSSWELLDSICTYNYTSWSFTKGNILFESNDTLITNGHSIRCNYFSISDGTLVLDSSNIYLRDKQSYPGFNTNNTDSISTKGTSIYLLDGGDYSNSAKIKKLTSYANTVIKVDCDMDTLSLLANSNLGISNNKTLTINDSLIIREEACNLFTRISTGYIWHGGDIQLIKDHILNNFIIENTDLIGSANVKLTNSILRHGSIGWNHLSTPVSKNLYWIGGSGDWDDSNHWSDSSGGAPTTCGPGPMDNVTFDSNSGTTSFDININRMSFCNNLICDSLPFDIDLNIDANIKIYASLSLKPGFNIKSNNAIFFRSDSLNETIDFSGNYTYGFIDLIFDGLGSWGMQDSISMINSNGTTYEDDAAIKVCNGTLRTNGHNLKTGRVTSSNLSILDSIDISNSDLYLNETNDPAWDLSDGGLISANKSRIFLTNSNSGIKFYGGGNYYPEVHAFSNCQFNDWSNDGDTIENLYLKRGNDYKIYENTTLYIDNDLILFDASSQNTTIRASSLFSNYDNASLSKASGNLCLNKVDIEGIDATGGATFTMGYGSNDLGGNTGWQSSNNYCHAYIAGQVFTHDSLAYSHEEVVLFDMSGTSLADTVAITSTLADGSYFFDNQALGNYLIMARPKKGSSSNYPPSYQPNKPIWGDATICSLMSDTIDRDIHMRLLSNEGTGTGYISGYVKEPALFYRGPSDPVDSIIIGMKNPGPSNNDVLMIDTTDSQGFFEFKNVNNGDYVIFPDVTGVPVDLVSNSFTISGGDTASATFIADTNSTNGLIYLDAITDLKDIAQNLRFYPNPVKDKLYFDDFENLSSARIYSISGSFIYQADIDYSNQCIDVRNINTGTYIIEVMIGEKRGVMKFVKD